MSKLHQKLTAIFTTLALVIAGFTAVTHHHDHSGAEHSCDQHAHHQCGGHSHSSTAQEVRDISSNCCDHSEYQFAPHLPHSSESVVQATGGSLDGDHLCVFCRFLTEQAAQISFVFETRTSTSIYSIAPVAIVFELELLTPAFLQRGPPVA